MKNKVRHRDPGLYTPAKRLGREHLQFENSLSNMYQGQDHQNSI